MEKYKIATAIIVNDKAELLLTKRSRDPFKGKWALISGVGASKVGLLPEKGVIEEVKADIGTDTFDGIFLFSIPLSHDPQIDENFVFVGKVNEDDIKPDPECSAGIKWVSVKNGDELKDLAFEHEQIINRYLQEKT